MLTDQAILRHIEKQAHRAAGLKQLIRELSLRGVERKQLPERLQSLVKSGRLVETGRDRYMIPAVSSSHPSKGSLGGAPGKYSTLLHAEFQSQERTLRDDEVAQWSAQIVKALEGLGGALRS